MTVNVIPSMDAPCPRVEVFIDSGPADAASVTVTRLAGGTVSRVRGMSQIGFAGAVTRVDFEVPFGVPVTYRAEFFSTTGRSLGVETSEPAHLDVWETWMHNPLDPQGAVRVVPKDTAAQQISRPVPGEVSRPIGRRVGVILTQPRQGLAGLVFDLLTETFSDADKIQAMLGDDSRDIPPVLCIRKGVEIQRMRIPPTLFLGVLSAVEDDLTVMAGLEGIVHRITGDEVAPPVPGIFVPLLTRADLNAFYQSRAALNADNLARVDVNRRYDIVTGGASASWIQ